jgi:hypothetical protein
VWLQVKQYYELLHVVHPIGQIIHYERIGIVLREKYSLEAHETHAFYTRISFNET